jgi:GAF domain-containing protein
VLEIGPYQSDILATAHILIGKGVCGTCWEQKTTRLINRVRECKNYIACDNVTKAEICVPVFDQDGEVKAVFDIDSLVEDCFCQIDQEHIEEICRDYL